MGSVNTCLIDDALDHDVPLVELTLTGLQAEHSLVGGDAGSALTTLSFDYYNRSISAWEPIVEPWRYSLERVMFYSLVLTLLPTVFQEVFQGRGGWEGKEE